MPYSHTSGFSDSITTRHFIDHIGLCYSHKIRYIIIWLLLCKSLDTYTYRDTGITEMDSSTGSIYLEDPSVDRHHLIIQNTHRTFPSFWSHAHLLSFMHECNLGGSSWPGIILNPLTLILRSLRQNCTLSRIPFRYHATCGGVLIMVCLPSPARCDSVRKPHAVLPDTLGNLTSASKYFQTLPDPPGAKQSVLRLCKSILRCS
jgi:hypothetical protein